MTDRSVRLAFAAGSVLLVVWTALWIYKDNVREWRPYQAAYAAEMRARGTPGPAPAGIQQVVLDGLDRDGLDRIDRCPTCHLGTTNPAMMGAPSPLAYHAGSETHPPDRFGCTACHGGQGMATTVRAAHGRVEFWDDPLRDADAVEWACGNCHLGNEIAGAPRLSEGRRIYAARGCGMCHNVRGKGGERGPNLTEVGLHREEKWLFDHFLDPQAVVPGSKMPNLHMAETEAWALTFYMRSLRGEVRIPSDYLVLGPSAAASASGGITVAQGGAASPPGEAPAAPGGPAPGPGPVRAARVGTDKCLMCHDPRPHAPCPKAAECESCHGPGSLFVEVMADNGGTPERRRAAGLRIPPRSLCDGCHARERGGTSPDGEGETDAQRR